MATIEEIETWKQRSERLSKMLWYSGGRQKVIAELEALANIKGELMYGERRLLMDARSLEIEFRRRCMRQNVIQGGKT